MKNFKEKNVYQWKIAECPYTQHNTFNNSYNAGKIEKLISLTVNNCPNTMNGENTKLEEHY